MHIWLQTPTPTVQASVWQITQDKVPYVVLLGVAALAFLLGTVFRPVLEEVGNGLRRWVKGLGKTGDFRQRYLTSIIGQYRHSAMLPANVVAARWEYRRKAMELEELYTPLSLGGERGEELEGRLPTAFQRSRGKPSNRLQALWWRMRPPVEPTAGDVGETILNQPRLVIRGDPGSGKTTLLRYLALSCARSLRNDRKDGDARNMVGRRLGWHKRLFPIVVPLNLLANVSSWSKDRRLIDEIANTLPSELRSRYPAGFLEKQLGRGNCLVLLDGFDELGSRSARGKMAQLIAEMAEIYHERGNYFVVSTRIVGYEGQLEQYGFAVRTVQKLDDEAIRELVTRRYRAIAIQEGIGRSVQEQQDLRTQYEQRASRLLLDLERNQGLRTLTTNPLLLSLIVLVHLVQIKLPEQRHLLYRDCVEILTERWRERTREEVGLARPQQPDDLTLDQKITLLQEIALTMQKQRQTGDGSGLLDREQVVAIIAARLPRFIAAYLPREEAHDSRCQECERRANALLDSIREESGILVEKGLNLAGEPVVGFSHLTFQEYLAADALREAPHERVNLYANLFSPTWREVLLLYVAMLDAGEVIRVCLEDQRQPSLVRYLLAGRCLAEKVTIEPALRQQVLDGLRPYFRPPAVADTQTMDDLLHRIGGENNLDWLIGDLTSQLTQAEKSGLEAPANAGASEDVHTLMQNALLRIMQESSDSVARYTAGCVLSGIGDPRNLDEMVAVSAGEFVMGSDPSKDSDAYMDEQPQHRLALPDFRIGKYPVTNAQYQRFVAAKEYRPPGHWTDGKLALWQGSHPVVNVSWHDAIAYCAWLTETTGQTYRLPTEAEWERAARGDDARKFPWGGKTADERLCNFGMKVGETTAVGSYPAGASPCGALDMAGNVWEWTSSLWGKDWLKPEFGYPYDSTDGRENQNAPDTMKRTLRGGSFGNGAQLVRCAYRARNSPNFRLDDIGFRVVSPGF